jgi:pectate lyase
MEVTNLNDSGTGSLRACMTATGARTCVFKVSGTISLLTQIRVTTPLLTVAGQTAPGGGIAVRNDPSNLTGSPIYLAASNIILRHIRVRPGPTSGTRQGTTDSITIDRVGANIILDHVSLSWATDEPLNTTKASTEITIQDSLIYEGLSRSTHEQVEHSKGAFLEGTNITFVRNMIAHATNRCPNAGVGGRIDVVNNICYNYGDAAGMYFSMLQKEADPNSGVRRLANIIGNYCKAGPDSQASNELGTIYGAVYWNEFSTYPNQAEFYVQGNLGCGRTSLTADERTFMRPEDWTYIVSTPHGTAASRPAVLDVNQAITEVLAKSGAWPRDSSDTRVTAHVTAGTGAIIDSPTEVGGWPTLASGTAYTDADQDGMDDAWEVTNGLSPTNAADRNTDQNSDGYTNLEEFLHYRHLLIMGLEEPEEPASTIAFPGAVGYGSTATGGRGGSVIQVTNLNDTGSGSLRACVEATGARTCVFRVSGTIQMASALAITAARSDLTIAGQTAPGGGITLVMGPTPPASGSRAAIWITGEDVIIRHIRIRMQYPNTVTNGDAVTIEEPANRIYLDHMSLAWASDENLNLYGDWQNVTVANSILAEGLDDHSKCMLTGDDGSIVQHMTIYQNLCTTNNDRNPNLNSPGGSCQDIINNVFFNPRSEFGEIFSQFGTRGTTSSWASNYFKAGPATVASTIAIFWNNTLTVTGGPEIYHDGGNVTWAPSGKTITFMDAATTAQVVTEPECALSAPVVNANQAYDTVMKIAGAHPRDSLDLAFIAGVGARGVAGTARSTIRTSPGTPAQMFDAANYPDADADGMDDRWEASVGLSSSSASDRNGDLDSDGFTNLEEFLHYKHVRTIPVFRRSGGD